MSDIVNQPQHYIGGRKYEPIDVIEDWELGFCLGNAVKYISRAGRKDDILQDLRKAQWYINRAVSELEAQQPQEIHPFTEELYGEILKAQPQDIGLDVDDATLDYWATDYVAEDSKFPCDRPGFVNVGPGCTAWDSDDSYMIEPKHSEYYYDVNRNRAYEDWTTDECGWDPTTGPTC